MEVRMDAYCKSASEYLTAYFNHHRPRYIEQPNSIYDVSDARGKYAGLSLFEDSIPRFITGQWTV
jgi:hypothetical protein